MIEKFKNYNLINLLFVIITGVIFWIYPTYNGVDYTLNISTQMPIYKSIIKIISYNNVFIPLFVSLLLIFGQLYLIQRLDFKYQFSGVRNFLAGFIFILLSSLIIVINYLHPIIYANIFLLLAIERIFDSCYNEKKLSNFFDASIFISLSSFLYFNYIFFIPLIIVAALILNPSPINEWILILVGVISTYIVYFAAYFIFNGEMLSLLNIIYENVKIISSAFYMSNIQKFIILGIIIFLLIITLIFFFKNISGLNSNIRTFFKILNLIIVFAILIYLFIPTSNYELILSMSVPLSFLASNFFTNSKRKKINDILFFIFIVSITFVHINYFFQKMY